MLTEALRANRETFGDGHPQTLASITWLAGLYEAKGEIEANDIIRRIDRVNLRTLAFEDVVQLLTAVEVGAYATLELERHVYVDARTATGVAARDARPRSRARRRRDERRRLCLLRRAEGRLARAGGAARGAARRRRREPPRRRPPRHCSGLGLGRPLGGINLP